MPDNESSYILYNGYFFKLYQDKDGGFRAENVLRNPEWMDEEYKWALDTLIDGEYPKNSKGETYGMVELSGYVGYCPDLGIDYWDIEDTRTLPTDFDAYKRMTAEDRKAHADILSLTHSSSAEINARFEALRNSV